MIIFKKTKQTWRLLLSMFVMLVYTQAFGQDVQNATETPKEEKELTEVVSVGTRTAPRTMTSTALPVDNISIKDIQSTGQPTFDKALQYRVPSFNTVNTPVNDATTLLDPWEIRNLGPSRTLILINGKRKNTSSLLYVQFSPGRGETGVDISAIPSDAIKNIEILRDGASAQYGSDALAGVVNIVLKDRYDFTTLNLQGGITGQGDGGMGSISLNSGANFGKKGFVNYTVQFQRLGNAVRSGKVSVDGEVATFGADRAEVEAFLKKFPNAGNINGTGDVSASKFLINAGIPVGDHMEVYGNAAYVYKKVISNANYRTPYWVGKDNNPLYTGGDYNGYMPTFEGDLHDYNGTIGVKNVVEGWKTDASFTVGGNTQTYTVNNTFNHSLGLNSPISFKPGGYAFHHFVGNLDITKVLASNFSLALGSEVRGEVFQIIAGDTASYSGKGANSFPGFDARNASVNTRFNAGLYADASFDITKEFLLNAAARYENYSDFGDAFVSKLSARLKLLQDKLVFRASISDGFRAPSLHQIYQQNNQAAFQGGTIQTTGLFNNKSAVARQLGIGSLKPEKSINFTAGIGAMPNKNFSITVDYYYININDRIVYSSTIKSSDPNSDLGKILKANGIVGLSMFINGVETNTQGIDFVATYKNIVLGTSKLAINLSGNYVLNNEIVGNPNDSDSD